VPVPPARHLLRARDFADAHYKEPIGVDDMAKAAGLSRAHFSRAFRSAFGESPRSYLLTRRLERAAALLRTTDYPVIDICFSVGLQSLGSFTTSFTRTYGMSPTAYRAANPPAAAYAQIPACFVRMYSRPVRQPAARHPASPDGPGRTSSGCQPAAGKPTDRLEPSARLSPATSAPARATGRRPASAGRQAARSGSAGGARGS
jgi:AraC-like DNA-binding protein